MIDSSFGGCETDGNLNTGLDEFAVKFKGEEKLKFALFGAGIGEGIALWLVVAASGFAL